MSAHIFLVAAEESGDRLGAALIAAISFARRSENTLDGSRSQALSTGARHASSRNAQHTNHLGIRFLIG